MQRESHYHIAWRFSANFIGAVIDVAMEFKQRIKRFAVFLKMFWNLYAYWVVESIAHVDA